MLNFLVETKNEYTIHLVNILTPLIFEGIQSIYIESLNISNTDNVLKIFQAFLKRIPKWNRELINKEASRITNSTQSYGWLNDLIKATIKANLVILIYNPTVKIQTKIDHSFYQNINITDFIHKVYCECARELWNNPDLLFHNYPPLEIKRNQRKCLSIIKDCIREAIRKLIPVRHILKIYLGEDIEFNNINDEFEKVLTDAEEKNLPKMIKKDLEDKQLALSYHGSELNENYNKDKQTTDPEQTIRTRIFNILDKPDSRKPCDGLKLDTSDTYANKQSESNSDIDIFKSLEGSNKKDTGLTVTVDEKIKQVLYNKNKDQTTEPTKKKYLDFKEQLPDSELHTSLNYTVDNVPLGPSVTTLSQYQALMYKQQIQLFAKPEDLLSETCIKEGILINLRFKNLNT
jgi:hypothetical protein